MPDPPPDAPATPPPITLDQFLKFRGAVGTGGQAKMVIQDGEVTVNGAVETRRRRKMQTGDVVEVFGERLVVGED